MSTKRATKRALLTSILAICLCLVMLIGSTFAWFTDTASTGVNKIQSGTLKVDIVDATESYTSLKGKPLTFQQAVTGGETKFVPMDQVLWEPGATFYTQGFQIMNTGNLALKYKVVVSGITGNSGLLKVIHFDVVNGMGEEAQVVNFDTTPGTLLPNAEKNALSNTTYYLRGHMDESAGNDYMNMSLTGIAVTVYATQLNSENDSFGPNYDEKATYPAEVWNGDTAENITKNDETKTISVSSGDVLAALAQKINAGEDYSDYTIKLTGNIDLNGIEWTPIGTASNPFKGTFDGDGYAIRNLKITNGDSFAAFFGTTDGAKIENLTVSGEVSGTDVAGLIGKAKNTTVTNCVSNVDVTATAGKAAGIAATFGGTLTNSENHGEIITMADQPVGGLVAWCNTSTIENCHNYGSVTVKGSADGSQAGGLAGNLCAGTTVKNSSNNGNVTSGNYAGGVAGRANGDLTVIEGVTNNATITGNYAAGLVADAKKGVAAKDSTINGTINGTSAAGGVFAWVQGSGANEIGNCTVNASVSATAANCSGNIVGILGGTVTLRLNGTSATNDVGCFDATTLTIIGRTPNNIDFTAITGSANESINGFVHKNAGQTKTITVKTSDDAAGSTYSYAGAPSYVWAK